MKKDGTVWGTGTNAVALGLMTGSYLFPTVPIYYQKVGTF